MEGTYELAASCLRVREKGVSAIYGMKWLALCYDMPGEIYARGCEIAVRFISAGLAGCIGTEEFCFV
jgi:hypothetical protein